MVRISNGIQNPKNGGHFVTNYYSKMEQNGSNFKLYHSKTEFLKCLNLECYQFLNVRHLSPHCKGFDVFIQYVLCQTVYDKNSQKDEVKDPFNSQVKPGFEVRLLLGTK